MVAGDLVFLGNWLTKLQAQSQVSPALGSIIISLSEAVRELSDALRVAAIEGNTGYYGLENVHGEVQKCLDVVADEIFSRHLDANPDVGAFVSEERTAVAELGRSAAPYSVCFDPLDGSSNSDVNMTVGSIFSIRRWSGEAEEGFLLPGRGQLAAGFAAYGPATSLVVAVGGAVALFQFEPRTRAFVLIEDDLRIPQTTSEYAINSSRAAHWDDAIAKYVEARTYGQARFNMRWTGSMVADVQRILRRGGVFLYPADSETRLRGGRLRLLYEAAPIALIVETAGGRASTGRSDLLDIAATDIHQRVPVILGSSVEVDQLVLAYKEMGET